MVLLTAAAITAAGVGVYKGGQAAATDISKKVRRHKAGRLRQEERKIEHQERERAREQDSLRTENMSAKERIERFKKSVPKGQGKKGGLFRKG